MSATRYRAPPTDALLIRELDGLFALYHRASGMTHLLASPAPELIALLGERAMTPDELMQALVDQFDVGDANPFSLTARLEELLAIGLVEAA